MAATYTPDGQMQSTWHIRVGSSFIKPYIWKTGTPATPVDLTGWTAVAHIRAKIADATPVLSLSTTDGTITLGADGTIVISLTPTDTALLSALKKAVFDLELTETATGFRRNLIGGEVVTYPEVTRE